MKTIRFSLLLAGCVLSASVIAEVKEVRAAAALKHAIGVLALKQVQLVHAGKIDDVYALRTAAEQADWKKASARDKKEFAEFMPLRAPKYAAFEAALRKDGVIKIDGNRGELNASLGKDGMVVAYYELEGGQWRGVSGPVVIGGEPEPANEERINGAMILDHPIADVAMKYVTAVQAGQMDKAMGLTSKNAQTEWKTLPASEKKESAAFLKKMLPAAKTFRSAIESGGLLIVENNERATLNIITTKQSSSAPGVVSSTSETSAIPFVFEDGVWKVAK